MICNRTGKKGFFINLKQIAKMKFFVISARVAALVPWSAVAKASKMSDILGCWLSRQTSATSKALSELLTDFACTRRATLQNRAAIDFLLLAQGHGCEDFEGMCCMNLSDHCESIHHSIHVLREGVKKLQNTMTRIGLLDCFGTGVYQGGCLRWQDSLLIVIIIVVVLILFPYLIGCEFKILKGYLQRGFLVQMEGGDVETRVDRELASSADTESFSFKPWETPS